MTTLNIVGQTAVNGCRIQVGPVFTPASLFTASEQGAWYDPSDFSTLYQDSAGTTPVTAVEQPVGLMLDKSQGLVLGSEIITPAANQDFSSDTGYWNKTGTTSIGGGVCTIAGATNNGIDRNNILVYGKYYQIQFEIKRVGSGAIYVVAGTNSSPTFNTLGVKQVILTPANSLSVRFWAVGTTDIDIDNISIRELPGNHAYQATSAARPALRNRYNLLTYSEQFDNAAWTTTRATITANATTAPDGTTTADLFYPTSALESFVRQYISKGGTSQTVIVSLYFKPAGFSYILLQTQNGANGVGRWFNISTGTVESPRSFGTGWTLLDSQIQNIGDGWFRATIVALTDSSTAVSCTFEATDSDNTTVSTPSGTSGIYIWGAQVVTADDNTAIQGQYQRIAAAPTIGSAPTYDDDLTKFPPYLAFDGSDDSMATASIDFSATDEMSVFAGVTKLSDAATGMEAELSASSVSNAGAFAVLGYVVGGDRYRYRSGGSAYQDAVTAAADYAAPVTNVFTGLSDISADSVILRLDGAQISTNTGDQGTGNFGNYPLYIGSRGGTTLYFNGRIYGLIVRGVTSTLDEITSTEIWMSGKTGV